MHEAKHKSCNRSATNQEKVVHSTRDALCLPAEEAERDEVLRRVP
jgi:hypothetical protein